MKIFLIRHGESTSDVEDRYGGDYDDHLTEKGRAQAHALAERLRDEGIEVFFSSPKFRAKETAEVIASALGRPLHLTDDMKEQNYYGVLTGMRREDAAHQYPELVAQLSHTDTPPPGAEIRSRFIERVRNGFVHITHSPQKIIGVVTHAGPIRRLMDEILHLGGVAHIDHGAVVVIERMSDRDRWRVVMEYGVII